MSSRVRKQSDCPVGKQGPMRATLPVSSVMKQSGGLKKGSGNSPNLSPTNVWRRISPDHALSGQRSPGAVNYKGKGRFGANSIRRTASLDTLYHKGQWPRDYYLHAGQLQIDKATQTDDSGGSSGRSSRGSEDDKLDRFLRNRMQRPFKSSASSDYSTYSTSSGFWSRFGNGSVPLRAARSSVEGLNQEIERLVLYPASGTQTPHLDRLRDKITPEGHRAPLAELLRRSVNTQTPHEMSQTTHSSGGSVCSSPDLDGGSKLGTSPQINRFLAREPPDGCEKVNLKTGDGVPTETVCVLKPSGSVAGFTLRPSLGSAFQPLQSSSGQPLEPVPGPSRANMRQGTPPSVSTSPGQSPTRATPPDRTQYYKNCAIGTMKRLHLTLRFYATGSCLLTMADFAGISQASVCRIIFQVDVLQKHSETENLIFLLSGIFCRPKNKRYNGKITGINDQTIFNYSRVKTSFSSGYYGNTGLVYDSGYENNPYVLITLANSSTPSQNLYNEAQIRTRNVIESTFGV